MDNLGSFTDPDVQRCPFDLIRRLHEEAPVYRDPGTGFFVVSRYADINYVSAHPELFSNKTDIVINAGKGQPGELEVQTLYRETGFPRFHTLVTNDPPSHGHFRAIVDKVFVPSFVKQIEPYVAALADDLVDGFIERGEADLLQEFCVRLPMFVISDQLGLPRSEWLTFKSWSDASISLIDVNLSHADRMHYAKLHIELQNYLAKKRQEFLDRPGDSMLSRLAQADVDGVRLSESEFVNVGEQLLVAGNETTTSGIAHGSAMLVRDPELRGRLIATPALINAFVEEVLRIHAPSPHLYRMVLQDADVGGVQLDAGSVIMLSYLAGNHDPSRFKCPEQVDLGRTGLRNHLAFGQGIHYCIGNLLARAEMRTAFATLLRRIPHMRFSPNHPEPRVAAVYHVHAVENLHVSFPPGPRVNAVAAPRTLESVTH